MIDLRCKRFLIRRKRGRQSDKADEDGKRGPDSGFPLIRITHNLKQSGAIAAFWRDRPCPEGGNGIKVCICQSIIMSVHTVSLRLYYNGHGGRLNRCCPRANAFIFCVNCLKNVLTIAVAARFCAKLPKRDEKA